jgi:hypothetical protein
VDALNKYLGSSQLDSYAMPSVMEVETALNMTPRDFQSRVNEGPVVLVGPSGSTTFNISTLYRLVAFSSSVDCIGMLHSASFFCTHQASLDSDTLVMGEDEQSLAMTANEAAKEICCWQTSRPLIVTAVSRYTHVYQEVEKYVTLISQRLSDPDMTPGSLTHMKLRWPTSLTMTSLQMFMPGEVL